MQSTAAYSTAKTSSTTDHKTGGPVAIMGVIMMIAMQDDMREITRRFADADQDILKKAHMG